MRKKNTKVSFFDQNILINKKIFSRNKEGGKLAMRVFPPFSEALAEESIQNAKNKSIRIKKTQKMSESAKSTQIWQSKYFVSLNNTNNLDFDRIRNLLFNKGQTKLF